MQGPIRALRGRIVVSVHSIIVQGTVEADGTLAVTDKVPLPAGRVRIIIEPLPRTETTGRTLVEVMEQIRKEQAARGFHGLSRQEMEKAEAALREEEEEEEARWREIHTHTRHPLPPETTK